MIPTRAESFAQLGLYIARDFLNATECEAVRAEIDSAQGSAGRVYSENAAGNVHDPEFRRVKVHTICFGLDGVEGLLVAFRSYIWHEVTPIRHGRRYTLVTWYY